PLNSLIGETAKESQYGSALGTLSLMRQIGLTLFPTIFAGFITSSTLKLEPILFKEYGELAKKIINDNGNEATEGFSLLLNNMTKNNILNLTILKRYIL